MKLQILLFIVRVLRLLGMQDKFMPELDTVAVGQVRRHRLYQHYGRILLARRNPRPVMATFSGICGQTVGQQEYYDLLTEGKQCSLDSLSGQACDLCAMRSLGLPCRCDFRTGSFTGYYELVMAGRQYSDNISI